MEDIQNTDVDEQVEEQSTTLNFGQGSEQDTQESASEGQVNQELSNWNEDKRFKEHWGEDPNKMYETLRYHEKRQGEFDSQINDYKTQIEDLGKFKKDYESLEQLIEHPVLGDKLLRVIEEHQNNGQQVQDQQQVPQQQQHSPEMAEMLEWKRNLEQQALSNYQQQQRDAQIGQIDEFAKQYNLNYDKKDFVGAMEKAKVDPQNWVHYFKSHATDIAMRNAKNQAAEQALSNKNKAISSSANPGKGLPSLDGLSIDQALDRILT